MNVEVVKIDAQERIVDNTLLPLIITRKSEQSKNEDWCIAEDLKSCVTVISINREC
ncbi:MAG: hypothetical protein KJO61_04505 [Deltaproteobacteria bacterium]|nr:hypothetical protein [Deltaproteobacteria bacterium]